MYVLGCVAFDTPETYKKTWTPLKLWGASKYTHQTLEAGGKASSWFPPERLVKFAVGAATAYKIQDRYPRENKCPL